MSLRIHEIFFSLQGESSRIGFPTIFIRLTGCPLRCQYCDTEYAFRGGNMMTEQEILQAIAQYPCKTVCVTGGEPLAQKACFGLLSTLADAGYQVSLETSGAMDIAEVDARVLVVMDIKTPDSAEVEKNLWGNIQHLKPSDEIKFVICSRADFDWAVQCIAQYQLQQFPLIFSPSYHQIQAQDLAEWLLQSGVPARMQVQLHKILWGEKQRV